ncbi:MAG TPA: VOC family protein [Rhizobacter sp.]
MPVCRIDHITVTAPSLEAGSDLVHACLGLRPQAGGMHPRMGTHNLLLRLGDAMFLEVIAVDPQAAAPARPRWFELDRMASDDLPRLACWVARTDKLQTALDASHEALGLVEPMTRGALSWLISIPPDGSLPLSGAAPVLIEWQTSAHPAASLPAVGCRLTALELFHPEPARLEALLDRLEVREPGVALSVHGADTAAIVAHIDTPNGARSIGGRAPLPAR